MSSLVNSLREQFPREQTPFGPCVIVPSRAFQPEWEQQLKAEGYKVFSQSWNGEASFFVRLEKSHTEKGNRRFWTSSELEQLKQLLRMGSRPKDIAGKLNRSAEAIRWKMRKLGLNRVRLLDSRLKANPRTEDEVVKELLLACSLLYPSHRTACVCLLKEASSKILGELNGQSGNGSVAKLMQGE